MKISLKLDGAKQVAAAASRAPSVARTHLASLVARTARGVADRARQAAPVRTGTLKNSIVAEVRGLSGGAGISDGPAQDYWRHVEFGTERQEAHPFFRPAAEAQRPVFDNEVKDVATAIEKDFTK